MNTSQTTVAIVYKKNSSQCCVQWFHEIYRFYHLLTSPSWLVAHEATYDPSKRELSFASLSASASSSLFPTCVNVWSFIRWIDGCARKISFLCAQTSSGVQVLMEELIACYHQLGTIRALEGTSPSPAVASVHSAHSRLPYSPRSPRRKDTRTALSC